MDFLILGPLEVRAHGGTLPVGGPRQRALLAILLLNANRVVARDRLLEELSGGETASHTLTNQVSRLRKVLGDSRLLTQAPGYLLRVEPGELDRDRFLALLEAGRASDDPPLAGAQLREAESLWRGRALADVELGGGARVELARLEELRLCAVEARIDAELALGGHDVLVGELDALAREHPLREHLRGQLMLALYRAGRQEEALAVYRDARARLVEELGLEPGPRLRELEGAILRQDPALDLDPPRSAAALRRAARDACGAEPSPWPVSSRPRRSLPPSPAAAARRRPRSRPASCCSTRATAASSRTWTRCRSRSRSSSATGTSGSSTLRRCRSSRSIPAAGGSPARSPRPSRTSATSRCRAIVCG